MSLEPVLGGWAEPAFAPVQRIFRQNFAERGEVGASFAVWHRGVPVVQLHGGTSDAERTAPWGHDTACIVFSATKGVVAAAFLMLADRGEVSLDERVSAYWPGFAQAGKQAITVRMLLNHRSGLFSIGPRLSLRAFAEPAQVDEALEATAPGFPPGEGQAYGATAWGAFTGALFRRITGRSVGRWLHEQVAPHVGGPLRLGLPVDDPLVPAHLHPVPRRTFLTEQLPNALLGRNAEGRLLRRVALGARSWSGRAFLNPSLGPQRFEVVNERWLLALELPWMNAVTSAGALAQLYAMLVSEVDGQRLVRPEALEPLRARQTWSERDPVMQKALGWSQGFSKEVDGLYSPNPASFGHPGAGGAFGWADPDAELAMAYVPNQMDWHIRSPRAVALARAVYGCL